MKTDSFEKRLQRQTLRPPPAAWREEILEAARARIPAASPAGGAELISGWRALLARVPTAWGAVAALWLVIIGANSLMSGPSMTVAGSSAPAPCEAMTVWNLQRAEMGLLAGGLGESQAPAPRARPGVPAPRSDIRRDGGFGGCVPRRQFTTFA